MEYPYMKPIADTYNRTSSDNDEMRKEILKLHGKEGVCQIALDVLLHKGMITFGGKLDADVILEEDRLCAYNEEATIENCLFLKNKESS